MQIFAFTKCSVIFSECHCDKSLYKSRFEDCFLFIHLWFFNQRSCEIFMVVSFDRSNLDSRIHLGLSADHNFWCCCFVVFFEVIILYSLSGETSEIFCFFINLRDKQKMRCAIWTSTKRLVLYHLGSVALGSLIITLFKIPRLLLMFVESK